MRGPVRVPTALREPLVRRPYARRLIDRQLFGNRQMHRQVQERIRAAVLDAILGLVTRARQFIVILGMLDDPVERKRFDRR